MCCPQRLLRVAICLVPQSLPRLTRQAVAAVDHLVAPWAQRSGELVDALTQVKGVRAAFNGPRFHEAVLLLDRPASAVLRELETQGILGGFDLSGDYPELGSALLVCATETKTAGDIARYAAALGAAVQKVRAA